MPAPTQLVEMVKIGFLSRMAATGDVGERMAKGAIAYITEHGVAESKRVVRLELGEPGGPEGP